MQLDFRQMLPDKSKFSLMVGLLFVSALVSAVFAVLYLKASGELRGLQGQALSIENNRNVTRALAADAMEYSKRNPAIDPILQSFALKPAPTTPTSPKAGK